MHTQNLQTLHQLENIEEPALSVRDVLPNGLFEERRPRLQPLIAEIRRRRRHRLGPHATIAFENRETVLWHIQEVLRVEGRTLPSQVAQEVARYDLLLCRPGELRATVLVDGGPAREAEELCHRLAFDPETLQLRVRDAACFAECVDDRPGLSSPVIYVRFGVRDAGIGPVQLAELPAKLVLRGTLGYETQLPTEMKRALATDLVVGAGPSVGSVRV